MQTKISQGNEFTADEIGCEFSNGAQATVYVLDGHEGPIVHVNTAGDIGRLRIRVNGARIYNGCP